MGFVPGMERLFNIEKSINVIHLLNKMKRKKNPNQLKYLKIDKIHHSCMIKTTTLNKLVIEENYLNIAKTIYEKHTASSILSAQTLKAFPLKSETR